MSGQYRALSACPVCGDPLVTTRLGCHHCGSELVGDFAPCPYCALDDAELDVLRVFLASRGNMREVEKHLAVSYPTARARFGALLRKLGLAENGDEEEAAADPAASETEPPATASPGDAASAGPGQMDAGQANAGQAGAAEGEPAASDPTSGQAARDQVLAQVASGALAPDVAADLLRRLGTG